MSHDLIFIFRKHFVCHIVIHWDSICTGSGEQEGTLVDLADYGNSPEEKVVVEKEKSRSFQNTFGGCQQALLRV